MSERELELARRLRSGEIPEPPYEDSWVETSTNSAGQRVYRVVTVSRWEVIPGR